MELSSAEEQEASEECDMASLSVTEPVSSSNRDMESSVMEELKSCNLGDVESSVVEELKPSNVSDVESSIVEELEPSNVGDEESSVVEDLNLRNVSNMESSSTDDLKSSSVGAIGCSSLEQLKPRNVSDMESSSPEELKPNSACETGASSPAELKLSCIDSKESSYREELLPSDIVCKEVSNTKELKPNNEDDKKSPNWEEKIRPKCDMASSSWKEREPRTKCDMESSSSEDSEPIFLKSIPHEKGNCCVVLWYIQHFSTVVNYEDEIKSPVFIVNIKSEISWFLQLHLKMKNEPSFIGISLHPVVALGSDIKIACKINVVQTDEHLYGKNDCSTEAIIRFKDELFFQRLVRKDLLARNEPNFLKNDTLLIKCELNLETYEEDPKLFTYSIHHGKFRERNVICAMMDLLYTSRAYGDLLWCLSDGKMERVHKSITAAREPRLSEILRAATNEQALCLLAYAYTGNPYDVECVPLGLDRTTEARCFELLKHFTKPNLIALRTRMKVQKLILSIKIKNFSNQISCKRSYIVSRFSVGSGDAFSSKWALSLDLRRDDEMHFRLAKLKCPEQPFNIEFRTFALNIFDRYVFLNEQTMRSERSCSEAYTFVVQARHLQGNKAFFTPNNHLNLKIVMQITYSLLEECCENLQTSFSSEISEIDQNEPPDFVRLRRDLLKMYESEIHADLRVITGTDELKAHRFMLILHSPYMKRYFAKNPGSSHFQLKHMAHSTVDKMMLFMYSGMLHQVGLNEVPDLLSAAENYEFIHLRKEILRFCRKNLNELNCIKILEIAFRFKEKALKAEAIKVIKAQNISLDLEIQLATDNRALGTARSLQQSTQSLNLIADAGHSSRSSDQELSLTLNSSRGDLTSSLTAPQPKFKDQSQTECPKSGAESGNLVSSQSVVEEKDSKVESSIESTDPEANSGFGECEALAEIPRIIFEKDPKSTSSTELKDLDACP